MQVGKIKWFDPKKGYGFILDAEGRDVFVHYTAIEGQGEQKFKCFADRDVVEYEVVVGMKGLLATRARRILTPKGAEKAEAPKESVV